MKTFIIKNNRVRAFCLSGVILFMLFMMNDGVKLKVPYSFFGSIFDEIFPLFAEQRGM
jgi:hypothetical protein